MPKSDRLDGYAPAAADRILLANSPCDAYVITCRFTTPEHNRFFAIPIG